MRLVEGIIFIGIASAIHLGFWSAWTEPATSVTSGDEGAELVRLAPASPEIATLVRRWETGPQTSQTVAALRAPVTADGPTPPRPVALADRAPRPARPAISGAEVSLPTTETPPPIPEVEAISPVAPRTDAVSPTSLTDIAASPGRPAPAPRPMVLSKPPLAELAPSPDTTPAGRLETRRPVARASAAPPAPDRAATTPAAIARGSKTTAPSQNKQRARSSAAHETAQRNLRDAWGAEITARLYRSVARVDGTGRIGLALRLAPNGRLQSADIHRSSGDPGFDRAVLRAVRRGGRFAKAPRGLDGSSFPFTVTLTLRR